MGDKQGAYRVLVGKPERKRQIGRPGYGWKDNSKMDFNKIGCENVDWIDLAEDRDM
jgi:hypothetical protein